MAGPARDTESQQIHDRAILLTGNILVGIGMAAFFLQMGFLYAKLYSPNPRPSHEEFWALWQALILIIMGFGVRCYSSLRSLTREAQELTTILPASRIRMETLNVDDTREPQAVLHRLEGTKALVVWAAGSLALALVMLSVATLTGHELLSELMMLASIFMGLVTVVVLEKRSVTIRNDLSRLSEKMGGAD